MKNYDQSVEIIHKPNWSHISEHPYRILIIGGAGSGKTIVLLTLIKNQRPDFDKFYLKILLHMSKIHSNQSINCLLTEK